MPELLEEVAGTCVVKFRYSLNLLSANHFSRQIENKTWMKQYERGDWLWLPLTQHVSKETKDSLELLSVNMFTSGIDVLAHRDQVGPLATMKAGLFECRYLFLIGLTLSIIFGVLIWLIERWNNSEFSENSCGIFKGIWFGLVTMTTVGYGDIAPKSVLGKLVTIAWMITGVTLTAVLTSTITNVFAGLDHLEMGNNRIVAIDKSLEASSLGKYTAARIKYVNTYELLFDGLIKKDFDVGVVDRHVERKYRSKLDDLRLVKQLSNVFIQGIYRYDGHNPNLLSFYNCIHGGKLMKFSYVQDKYRLESEKPNIDINMIEFFSEPSMFTISILAAGITLFGVLFEAKLAFCKYVKKRSSSANNVEQSSSTHTESDIKKINYSLNLKQVASKEDLNVLDQKMNALAEEISSIKAALQLVVNRTEVVSERPFR